MEVQLKKYLIIYAIVADIVATTLWSAIGNAYEPPSLVYISSFILGLPLLIVAIYFGFKSETKHKTAAWVALIICSLVFAFLIYTSISVLR